MAFFIVVIFAVSWLAGCRSLPDVKLGQCEELDTKPFIEAFNYKTPDTIRYRYSFRRSNVEFSCNGITQQDDDSIYIAGFSNAGITLFSARWQNGQFSILRNNTKMPGAFLEKSVLGDLLTVYLKPSDKDDCFRRNLLDDTIWLEMGNELAGETGYYVAGSNDLSWVGVKKNKICYQAKAIISKENVLDHLVIENYKERYYSEIRIIEVSDGQGPKNRHYD